VPRLIKFSGVAQDETHKLLTGVVGVTFSLYKDQQGGSPLWVETQNAQADAAGHYTALLGSRCGRCAVEPVQFGYGALVCRLAHSISENGWGALVICEF
jgi:hypothetical protein